MIEIKTPPGIEALCDLDQLRGEWYVHARRAGTKEWLPLGSIAYIETPEHQVHARAEARLVHPVLGFEARERAIARRSIRLAIDSGSAEFLKGKP